MLTKCECQQCGQPIEFEAGQFDRTSETPYRIIGQNVDCPSCGKSTQLYMMRHAQPVQKLRTSPWTIVIGLAIVIPLLIFTVIGFSQSPGSTTFFAGQIFDFIALIGGILLYFIPSIVGSKKKNAKAIFTLNLLAGWTFIGWVVAMVWACTKD